RLRIFFRKIRQFSACDAFLNKERNISRTDNTKYQRRQAEHETESPAAQNTYKIRRDQRQPAKYHHTQKICRKSDLGIIAKPISERISDDRKHEGARHRQRRLDEPHRRQFAEFLATEH